MKVTKAWAGYDKVACDCGHYPEDHHAREGWCKLCGCTWYYPNNTYIKEEYDLRFKISEEDSA